MHPALPDRRPGHTALPARSDVVLVVDDVPDNLAMLHDALDAAGYTVLVATDGASALLRAAQAIGTSAITALLPGRDLTPQQENMLWDTKIDLTLLTPEALTARAKLIEDELLKQESTRTEAELEDLADHHVKIQEELERRQAA
jgi:HPt (histidine-containing phosphotransfer) domain-containing protein